MTSFKMYTSKLIQHINTSKPTEIIYCSDNNPANAANSSVCKYDLVFNEIIIHLNPDVVFLKGGNNSMTIYGIKTICKGKHSYLGDVFVVSCENGERFTLILR